MAGAGRCHPGTGTAAKLRPASSSVVPIFQYGHSLRPSMARFSRVPYPATPPRTGLLGGVFDPPHVGHVELARAAMKQLSLETLLVLVVADPGHKRATTPAEARFELTKLAFDDVPGVQVELDRHARTVDSLEERKLDDAVFILGADELADFSRWKRPERVLALVRLAVAMRPGVSPEQVDEARARLPSPGRILSFSMPAIPISSSGIRERVARRESIDALVPERVAATIARLGLYLDG